MHHISYLIYYNLLLHLLDQQWNGRTNKEIGHSHLIFKVCPLSCRRSLCLLHTSLSCASWSLCTRTWKTSTCRFSIHAVVTLVQRAWYTHICWIEDLLKKDTMVQSQWNPTTALLAIFMESVTELVFVFLGLRAAEMTALPSSVIQEAKTIASKVSQQFLVWFRKFSYWLFVLTSLGRQRLLCAFKINSSFLPVLIWKVPFMCHSITNYNQQKASVRHWETNAVSWLNMYFIDNNQRIQRIAG